jgi:hypothetical protein
MANALRLYIFKAICSTPYISLRIIFDMLACNHAITFIYVCCKVRPIDGSNRANSHSKLRKSCFLGLNHCLSTYIKFITILLYLFNHLITLDHGVTCNQLFCVTQLSRCLSHMLPPRPTSAFANTIYQWTCICIAS